MKWLLVGPKTAFWRKWGPKPSIFHWFSNVLSEGAPKDAFLREVTLFAEKPKMVEFHNLHEMGGM